MQKQRNRGQDGVGVATIKLNPIPGTRYISRKRSNGTQPLREVFEGINEHFKNLSSAELKDIATLKNTQPYIGEVLLGHLRYGTHGSNNIENVHPFLRQNNWMNRNLVLAGNFNLTNVDEMFQELLELGQSPKEISDTVTVLEKIGHFLDDEVQRLFTWFKADGYSNMEINELIFKNLDIHRLLKRASKKFDGGYVMAGLIGHGDSFILRDPWGIRPAFYYADDEIVIAASERPAIQTAFNLHLSQIKELQPGHALIVKKDGRVAEQLVNEPKEKKSCSFERIYFSRGTDKDIYQERKTLGIQLAPVLLEKVNYDFENTVFSFIPNTAESAFYGLIKGLEDCLDDIKEKEILALKKSNAPDIKNILKKSVRVEKICVKEEKLRTFIADDLSRTEMVSHVYDVTYGIVRNEIDTLVLMDDSIVRGTTLKKSIISIVSRLKPKKIIIVSSAPQIRYPDCYGIDMSKIGEFVAFKAMVELLKAGGQEDKIHEVYLSCKEQEKLPIEQMTNQVQKLYDLVTEDAITEKIARIIKPTNCIPEIEVVYQTLQGLHQACQNHSGDWYFSGNYPTPGGNRVVNRAFINFYEKKNERAY